MDIPKIELLRGHDFVARMSFAEPADETALQDIKQILFGQKIPAPDLHKDLTYEKI